MSQRVLGCDLGYATFGLALLERRGTERWAGRTVETLRTPPGMPFDERLRRIWLRVDEVIRTGAPELVAIEAQRRAQAGHRERGTTSDEAVAVREVTGLLRGLAWRYGLPLVEVDPATWRACLGLGRVAPKAQVQRAVRALVAGCPERMSEHAADAAAVALAGARRLKLAR